MLVEARTYRFRAHSAADPDEERSSEQVDEWRRRDPLETFGRRLVDEGALDEEGRAGLDAAASARVDEAVAFAEASPEPAPEALHDDVYAADA
jgi:TPP-dependent pyruvate/acetoin dehydrogenase alpha subunit